MMSKRSQGRYAFSGRLIRLLLMCTVLSSCHSQSPLPHPSSPSTSTTTTTLAAAPPIVHIQPLPVRPVLKSQMTAPEKCPATNPNAPVAPTDKLTTCDLVRTTVYTLGPEAMQLGLARVDPPKSLTSAVFEVNLTLDPASATAWAAFTAAHLHNHVAFIRDDLVLEAPIIEEQVTSGQVALTSQTAQSADELARLVGRST